MTEFSEEYDENAVQPPEGGDVPPMGQLGIGSEKLRGDTAGRVTANPDASFEAGRFAVSSEVSPNEPLEDSGNNVADTSSSDSEPVVREEPPPEAPEADSSGGGGNDDPPERPVPSEPVDGDGPRDSDDEQAAQQPDKLNMNITDDFDTGHVEVTGVSDAPISDGVHDDAHEVGEIMRDPVEGLTERYYDHIIERGRETEAVAPGASLRGPVDGDVVWRDGDKIAGFQIGRALYEGVPDDAPYLQRLEALGITREMLAQGVWTIRSVSFTENAQTNGARRIEGSDRTLAFYNGTTWRVVRQVERQEQDGRWAVPESDLSASEKEAIARVAQDTEFMLDVAASLRDNAMGYSAFRQALSARAAATGDESSVRAMNVAQFPYRYLDADLAAYLTPAISRMMDLGPAFYNALAGRAQYDATDMMAMSGLTATPVPIMDPRVPLTIRESTVCPPYQSLDELRNQVVH